MSDGQADYRIWIDWDHHVASLHSVPGFEMVLFFSKETYQANLRILTESGFRFL